MMLNSLQNSGFLTTHARTPHVYTVFRVKNAFGRRSAKWLYCTGLHVLNSKHGLRPGCAALGCSTRACSPTIQPSLGLRRTFHTTLSLFYTTSQAIM